MLQKKLRYQSGRFSFLFIISLLAFSCQKEDNYLYNKTGFVPERGYYEPRAYYPRQYEHYYRPYSRAYQNPYDNPPRNYYPYYDYDEYYIPPIERPIINNNSAASGNNPTGF